MKEQAMNIKPSSQDAFLVVADGEIQWATTHPKTGELPEHTTLAPLNSDETITIQDMINDNFIVGGDFGFADDSAEKPFQKLECAA